MLPLQSADPARVGPYVLQYRLGVGGMGVVYLAAAEDGVPVAVKVVKAELAQDPAFRQRFGQEIATLRRVRGPGVVAVLDAELTGDLPWVAMEYVEGPSLAAHVRACGPMSEEAGRALAVGMAAALRVLHGAGVVHRDVKPGNVLLAPSGPVLIDFGIARVDAMTRVTTLHERIGSPAWMAPESITGEGDPTPAVDIFAAALTVAYAVTGRPPFGDGPTGAMLYRAVHRDPDLDEVPAACAPPWPGPSRRPRPSARTRRGSSGCSPARPPTRPEPPRRCWRPPGRRSLRRATRGDPARLLRGGAGPARRPGSGRAPLPRTGRQPRRPPRHAPRPDLAAPGGRRTGLRAGGHGPHGGPDRRE